MATSLVLLLALCFSCYTAIIGLPYKPNEEWYYGRPEPGLMTQGGVWPLPWNITYFNFNHTVNPSNFQFTSFYTCDILDKALSRYTKLLFPGNQTGSSGATLAGLFINIFSPCPAGAPQFQMDESCKFTESNNYL